MDTMHFTVRGEISCLFSPDSTTETVHLPNIEVQLWYKNPMHVTFLGKSLTASDGRFVIEVDAPLSYTVGGKINDAFLKAFYNGEELSLENPYGLLTGLVAYWKLDESSGATASDETSGAHTGTLSSATPPTWATGLINNGLNFNGGTGGTTASYLTVPTSSDFDFGNGDFTYAFWIKPNNTSGYYTVIDTGYPTAGAFLLQFTVPNIVVVNISGTSIYTKTLAITPGTWYYIVVRRIAGSLEMIVNGTSLGAITYAGAISCPATSMLIGEYSSGGQNVDGIIDELGIWKGHGLTDEEITRLYNSGAGLQYPF